MDNWCEEVAILGLSLRCSKWRLKPWSTHTPSQQSCCTNGAGSAPIASPLRMHSLPGSARASGSRNTSKLLRKTGRPNSWMQSPVKENVWTCRRPIPTWRRLRQSVAASKNRWSSRFRFWPDSLTIWCLKRAGRCSSCRVQVGLNVRFWPKAYTKAIECYFADRARNRRRFSASATLICASIAVALIASSGAGRKAW